MKEVIEPAVLRDLLGSARCEGKRLGFVPTMGFLHEGHTHLLDQAHVENDLVVLSIFVNPTQFGPNEDFDRYPRDLENDRRLAQEHKVDVLFVPGESVMYPSGPLAQEVWVEPGELARYLCGASRPGHFRGVATVVAKLFAIVQPDAAYFGQKDAQQAVIITKMTRDLNLPLKVRVVPTVREEDGLARSSRNVYLSSKHRSEAAAIPRALTEAESLIEAGERNPRVVEDQIRRYIAAHAPSARIDYVTAADFATLHPLQGPMLAATIIAMAVFFGPTRLIDNTVADLSREPVRCAWPSE